MEKSLYMINVQVTSIHQSIFRHEDHTFKNNFSIHMLIFSYRSAHHYPSFFILPKYTVIQQPLISKSPCTSHIHFLFWFEILPKVITLITVCRSILFRWIMLFMVCDTICHVLQPETLHSLMVVFWILTSLSILIITPLIHPWVSSDAPQVKHQEWFV